MNTICISVLDLVTIAEGNSTRNEYELGTLQSLFFLKNERAGNTSYIFAVTLF